MKIGHKARHGRRSHPTPHKDHRRRPVYSRFSRLLKARWREAFAPTIEDFDRERLGERQERKAQSDVRVNRHLVSVMSGATAFSHTQNRGRSVAGPQTPGGKS